MQVEGQRGLLVGLKGPRLAEDVSLPQKVLTAAYWGRDGSGISMGYQRGGIK